MFIVFKKTNEWGDILINWPYHLVGTKVNNTFFNVAANYYELNYNVLKLLQHSLILVRFHYFYLNQ